MPPPVEFTSVAEAVELAWHVREGLLGLVGKNRPEGTTLITEDVCFPRDRLAQGAHDLQALLAKHGFMPGIAGHAAHGNLHFTLVARLDEAESRARYSAFMDELVELWIGITAEIPRAVRALPGVHNGIQRAERKFR